MINKYKTYNYIIFLLSLLASGIVLANPMGGNVTSGNINIQQSPNSTVINQTSTRGIINWQSFNIGAGQSTHFNQPNGGITLNRISPLLGASQIYGRLTATGQIILINSAGIYFGPSAYVNVGGLIASTADIADRDFLAGNYHFTQNSNFNGSIVNQGTLIAANNGLIALMGNAVQNDGTIQANLGHAVLGSGRDFSLTFASNDKISFSVNAGSTQRAVDKNGNRLADGVLNRGRISAGNIVVSAQAASGVLDNVINMRGFIEAKTAVGLPGGGVILGGNGTVRVAANINASGTDGGNVKITGTDVILEAPVINISGSVNGGSLETSGSHSLQSAGTIVNALGGSGRNGSWLIDPADLTICSACTTGGSNFLVTDLTNALASTNVSLQTALTGVGNGDIFINTAINYNSSNSLTLSAYRNIVGNQSISNAGSGDVSLIADNSGTGIGTVSFAVGKNISLNGGSAKIYYNPSVFGTQDVIYSGGTAPLQFMLINNANTLGTVNSFLNQNFALSKNIDANLFNSSISNFSGNFDGLGHIVSNLDIALFDTNAGSISNIGVSGNINGNGLLANNNSGSIDKAFSYGLVTGTDNVGGLVGTNSGSMTDVASFAAVNGNNNVGGLVGSNSGTINRGIAAGSVIANNNVGGLVGNDTGTTTNSYYDSNTTGIAGGNITAALMTASTFTNWDMNNTWGIIEGYSYPYLKVAYPTTPRVVSGQISAFSNYIDNPAWAAMPQNQKNPDWSSLNPLALAQQEVSLAISGSLLDKTYSAANGSYYFLESNSAIADSSPMIAYLSNSSNKANTITLAPTNGSSLKNFDLALNTVLIKDNGQLTTPFPDPNYTNTLQRLGVTAQLMSINHSDLSAAIGSLNDAGILFTAAGADIMVNPNINFVISPTIFYKLTGNIFTNNGSITSHGFLAIGTLGSTATYTMQTNGGGNILTNNVVWPIDENAVPESTLFLNAANNIILNGFIDGVGLDTPTISALGSLKLSAAYTNQSITTGPATSHYMFLLNLEILQGKWYQNNPAEKFEFIPGSVQFYHPALLVLNDFTIGDGTFPSNNAEFIRVGGGAGTLTNPYLIYDPFGFQGIASNTDTLSKAYRLSGDDGRQDGYLGFFTNFSLPNLWNHGAGIQPVGNMAAPFTGSFDGNNINVGLIGFGYLDINLPTTDNVGLFGVTSSTAHLFNLNVFYHSIIGKNNVGVLVGVNNGLIENIQVSNNFINGQNNVGSLVGINNGTIRNVGSYSNRIVGVDAVGGIAGLNNGTIDKSYNASYVLGTSNTGGLAGVNQGLIRNSFWDAGMSGLMKAAGINSGALDHVTPGCLGFLCSVNLTDKRTYLTTLDGGYGLVSSSWDLTNTWAIVPGISYPYLKDIFLPGGGAPIIYSGITNAPNQVILMLWGSLNLPDLTIPNSADTVTGANGRFYFMQARSDFKTGDFVLFDFIGGNTEGSVGFVATNNPGTNMIRSQVNIPLPATFNANPSNSTKAFTGDEIFAIFAGIPVQQLYTFNTNNFTIVYNATQTLFLGTQELYNRNASIIGVLAYQYNLVQIVRSYFTENNLDYNLESLAKFQKSLDQQIIKQYDIKKYNYCAT